MNVQNMDAESLQIILKLQRENTLLKRGIEEAVCFIISSGEKDPTKNWDPLIPEFDIEDLRLLFNALTDRLYKHGDRKHTT